MKQKIPALAAVLARNLNFMPLSRWHHRLADRLEAVERSMELENKSVEEMGPQPGKSRRPAAAAGGFLAQFHDRRNAARRRLFDGSDQNVGGVCRRDDARQHDESRARRPRHGTRPERRRNFMNLAGNKSRLAGLTKELALQWEQTKNYWRDAKSAEFEHKYIEELLVGVDKAAMVIDKLDELVRKVIKDCE